MAIELSVDGEVVIMFPRTPSVNTPANEEERGRALSGAAAVNAEGSEGSPESCSSVAAKRPAWQCLNGCRYRC